MNLNLETADRDVYNALDWVREMGGFQRGLRTIFNLFLIIMTYNHYETYMVSNLFKVGDRGNGSDINVSRRSTNGQRARNARNTNTFNDKTRDTVHLQTA